MAHDHYSKEYDDLQSRGSNLNKRIHELEELNSK